MGTEYKLYEDDSFGTLTIDETSNKLELWFTKCDGYADYSKEMSPEEMAKIFLKGLTICSYWMDSEELREMIHSHCMFNLSI